MIYSHRGNLVGKFSELENHPEQILKVLEMGISIEIDVWEKDYNLWFGHDKPQYEITDLLFYNFIVFKKRILFHCKDLQSILHLKNISSDFEFFTHENDKIGVTSKGKMITTNWFNCEGCILVCDNPKFNKLPKGIVGLITDYSLHYSKLYGKI